jgi:hypothetical protein
MAHQCQDIAYSIIFSYKLLWFFYCAYGAHLRDDIKEFVLISVMIII